MIKIYANNDSIKICGDTLSNELYKTLINVIQRNAEYYDETLNGVIWVDNPTYKLIYELSEVFELVIE